MSKNRYIISGGPGSGKSSLLSALIKEGHRGFEEVSRKLIQEQHEINGDKLPWKNLADFAETCYERMCEQLEQCNENLYCFYDRGLPDIIAYVRRGGLPVPEKYFAHCDQYNRIVFLAPPWRDIFVNDDERPESFEDSKEIFEFLKSTYEELGFEIVILPKISISERAQFIEDYLSACND